MNKCDLFKLISENVWKIVSQNHHRNNRLNEEGITRQTVIDLIQNYVENHTNFNVFAQKARNEVNTGGDLEIYLDNGKGKFYRILLQAKLMEINGCYEHLNRDSGSTGRKQYDTLKIYANHIKSDAYYLLYNGYYGYQFSGDDCAGNYDEKQLGCTIINIDDIKTHCERNSTGRLGKIDNPKPFGRPWRILTCCDYDNINENKLYNLNEIDMDSYFQNLFTPPNLISFITPEQIRNQQVLENSNEFIHRNGWKPEARIIISGDKMKKNEEGLLEIL